jgi:hypothetical protein
MTRLKTILAIAAISLASPALAQMAPDTTNAPPAPPAAQPEAPYAGAAGANASTGPVSADQLPAGQASALAAGDNRLLTNGPVPDTRANRAKYGGPMSNAGRHTKPIGN